VHLFSINPENSTAEVKETGKLRIVEIPGRLPEDATKDSFNQMSPPPAFLQIGDWLYPLIPYNSPVYRSEEGHYIFPDVKADKAGAATGLVLPEDTLQLDVDEFENILKTFTGLEEFSSAPPYFNTTGLGNLARKEDELLMEQAVSDIIEDTRSTSERERRESIKEDIKIKDTDVVSVKTKPKPKKPDLLNCGGNNQRFGGFGFGGHPRNEPQWENHSAEYLSTKIAGGILAGAEVITRGMTYGASKTSEILDQGTGLLKSYSQGPTTSPKKIHKKLHAGVKVVKNYTGTFVELSTYVVDELGNATEALAAYLSPYLHETTTTLVKTATGGSPSESNYIVNNFLEVTSGTLQGMHMVYPGLHEAARILARSITNNTVDAVTHYYGPKAGEIINDAAETVGNIAFGGANAQAINPKSVVKRAAKDTGVALLTKEDTAATGSSQSP